MESLGFSFLNQAIAPSHFRAYSGKHHCGPTPQPDITSHHVVRPLTIDRMSKPTPHAAIETGPTQPHQGVADGPPEDHSTQGQEPAPS